MIYQFPKTKFTEETDLNIQRKKILSEAVEFSEAFQNFGPCDYGTVSEAMDIMQAIETYFRQVEKIEGKSFLNTVKKGVIKKNHHRGYYCEKLCFTFGIKQFIIRLQNFIKERW